MSQSHAFGREFDDFAARVEELRAAQANQDSDPVVLLDAALVELEHAVDFMLPAYEQFTSSGGRPPSGARAEQRLFKAIFENLPVPVALVDGETVVRRVNAAAAALTGLPAGYAAGRPVSGFLRPGDRPALRSQTAAVARGEGSRSLAAQLAQRTGSRVRVTLSEAHLPGESEPAVLVVLWPTSDHAWSPADRPAPATAASASVAAREAALIDLLDRTSAALLGAAAQGPVTALRAATSALREELADWAILDLLHDGVLTRLVVSGPEESDPAVGKEIAEQDPTACPVVLEAVGAASAVLDGLTEDRGRLGPDSGGASLMGRADVGSLLSVALTSAVGEPPVRGAVTLLRTGVRPSFSLAEARCVERIAGHMAIVAERNAGPA
ncbi:PAS domain-containing protein [Streptomyces sp. OR43]|uniref:PAS domain-containing protein n=1 Tax=Streptomyces sp. or43 TaxID=2478957 RepID=UPI0011CEC4C1|nr:PAS domain-containing protein [Streptomyces sp. or43]TXS39554.1 PAS domain S-box protein [Streptomyces sp. or43]